MLQKPKIIAFSHIPKTAGTSFNHMIRRYFGQQLISARPRSGTPGATYRKEDLDNDHQIYKNPRCISGHCLKPFVDFKEHADRLMWFTFLREPEKRLLSQFVHQQTSNVKVHKMDFPAWCKRFHRKDWLVKWIAGEHDLNAAQQILAEKFSAIGLVEHFDDSVKIFKRVFQLTGFVTTPPKQKMTIRDPTIKQEIIEKRESFKDLLEEQTELDRKLYDHVCQNTWKLQAEILSNENVIPGKPQSKISQLTNLLRFEYKDRVSYRRLAK